MLAAAVLPMRRPRWPRFWVQKTREQQAALANV
jgi:hypothetical protein